MSDVPTFADVRAAATRIAPFVLRTPVMRSQPLDRWLGTRAWLKCEHLQAAGAFKLRGATNAVRSLGDGDAARGVCAHSSGNHAAALAVAALERGIPAHVVMPSDVSAVKRARVEAAGAHVVLCEPTLAARESALRAVVEQTGATEIHPYDDPRVIAGAGTAALELLEDVDELDVVIAPVGGGGLLSGTSIAVHGTRASVRVIGAEPAGADDAARSLAAGRLLPQEAPDTIADGLRTSLSERTFTILSSHVERIVTVTDDDIRAAQWAAWTLAGQAIEPSAAVALAALRAARLGDGVRVGVIVSGGNVDFAALRALHPPDV